MTESLNFYDTIGRQYSQVREADPRVTEMLLRELALQPGKCIADVGAGTGNYALALAERGYHVRAVEPSQVMLSQARPHPQVQYSQGYAEELPLENAGVDAMICVNAIHHFRDLDRAVREMDRVCNEGRIVILTADVRLAESYWFNDYFPDVFDNNLLRFQPLNDLVVRLRRVSRRVRPEQAQRAGEPHQPQTRERRAGPSAAQRALHPGRFPRGHQPLPATTLMSLNIGRYMAISMPPTMDPMITIMTGSMMEVSASTAASTSSS